MRVLLAVDGSEQAHQAAESVGCLASVKNLIVVHVIDLHHVDSQLPLRWSSRPQ